MKRNTYRLFISSWLLLLLPTALLLGGCKKALDVIPPFNAPLVPSATVQLDNKIAEWKAVLGANTSFVLNSWETGPILTSVADIDATIATMTTPSNMYIGVGDPNNPSSIEIVNVADNIAKIDQSLLDQFELDLKSLMQTGSKTYLLNFTDKNTGKAVQTTAIVDKDGYVYDVTTASIFTTAPTTDFSKNALVAEYTSKGTLCLDQKFYFIGKSLVRGRVRFSVASECNTSGSRIGQPDIDQINQFKLGHKQLWHKSVTSDNCATYSIATVVCSPFRKITIDENGNFQDLGGLGMVWKIKVASCQDCCQHTQGGSGHTQGGNQ